MPRRKKLTLKQARIKVNGFYQATTSPDFQLFKSKHYFDPADQKYKVGKFELTHFDDSTAEFLRAAFNMWVESHWEMMDTLGRVLRPISIAAAYDGSYAAFSATSDFTSIFQSPDQIVDGGKWQEWNYPNGTDDMWYDYHGRINTTYTGTITLPEIYGSDESNIEIPGAEG